MYYLLACCNIVAVKQSNLYYDGRFGICVNYILSICAFRQWNYITQIHGGYIFYKWVYHALPEFF